MKTGKPCTQGLGFTLFELLLVMSILGVVFTIGFTGFIKISGYWNDLSSAAKMDTILSSCFDEFRMDIENILSARRSETGVSGQQATVEDSRRYWQLSFEDDRISMAVEYLNPLTSVRERFRVHYKIERSEGASSFVRYASPLEGSQDTALETFSQPDILGMRILYSDGNVWHNQWNKRELPKAFRISLSIMDPRNPTKHISRMMTFKVNAK